MGAIEYNQNFAHHHGFAGGLPSDAPCGGLVPNTDEFQQAALEFQALHSLAADGFFGPSTFGIWRELFGLTRELPGLLHGIDISRHQDSVKSSRDDIDWAKVAASPAVQWLWAKISEGVGWTDPQAANYREQMLRHNIPFGWYHFATPADVHLDAEDEAEWFCNRLRKLGEGWRVPPVLDVEGAGVKRDWADVTPPELTEWIIRWMRAVEAETGCKPILYTGSSYTRRKLDWRCGEWPLWIAHYTSKTRPTAPEWAEPLIWQHSSDATIPGIKGDVDENIARSSFAELIEGGLQ